MKTNLFLTGIALVITSGSIPAVAHHSAAPFDFTKNATLTGTVKQFEVINPHTHAVLTISDAKGTRDIGFEGHSASNFYRAGWRKGSVKAGDRITINFAPRRDGGDGGFIMQFKDASGKQIGFGGLSPSSGKQE